jgi:hypothetical protein
VSTLPRYPVYVISKGRYGKEGRTARFLLADKVPFKLVVEPQEFDQYAEAFGAENILVLPFSNLGLGSIPARNWVWEHSKAAGHARHWILDDNIWRIYRRYRGHRIACAAGPAFAACEDFIDQYENIAIGGMNYTMFCPDRQPHPPFFLNVHVYSCLCIRNDLPQRWRGRYNEDTDLCLQVLASGLCTVLFNSFLIFKTHTMTMKGGNSDELYKGDGRLKMARALERMWPGVVKVDRRFKRPQHVVDWGRFKFPLKRRADAAPSDAGERGMKLKALAEVKSDYVRALIEDAEPG